MSLAEYEDFVYGACHVQAGEALFHIGARSLSS